jgi:glutathione peroxidase-family protein
MLRIATLSLFITMAIGIYDFKVPGLEGGSIDLSKYKGKKILIVNTASNVVTHRNTKSWKHYIKPTTASWW